MAMAKATFRIISYNVLDGFTTLPERRAKVARWLAGQQADVVALCELNAYTEERLAEEARAWGHEHAILLKRDGYPTGLASRTPITDVQRVTDDYHHGVLHGRTAEIDFLVVHLSPHEFSVRAVEAVRIAEWATALMSQGRDVVVLGDFNSLSPADRPHYEASGMLDFHRDRPESRASANFNRGMPDFSVHQTLLDAGLVDVVARHTAVGRQRTSCATPLIREEGTDDVAWQRGQRRIDFIMASGALADRSTGGRVVNDPSMDFLSDHYPVVAEFA
jgi:exodeoxyribonuclease III